MGADAAKTKELLDKLAILCGPVPAEITNLTELFSLSARAGALNLYHVDFMEGYLELLFNRRFQMPADFPAHLLNRFGPERVKFIKSKNGDGLHLVPSPKHSPLAFAKEVCTFLESILSVQKWYSV